MAWVFFLFLAYCFSVWLAFSLGALEGCRKERADAVRAGAAIYELDEYGEAVFIYLRAPPLPEKGETMPPKL